MTDEKPFVGNEIDYRYVEYLRANAAREGDCLICHLSKANNGYCMVPGGGYAHRLVYSVRKGPIPEGLLVRHTCDVRSCIEDNHLIIGTNKDNTQDMMDRGRHRTRGRIVTEEVLNKILDLKSKAYNDTQIGRMLGINMHTIRRYTVYGKTVPREKEHD